jgi:hydroxymethylbilane synthase
MAISELRLGTRGSQLALWQARTVAARIAESGGPQCSIVVIRTSGDQLQDVRLSEIGGKALFVKEIEDALLRHEIDLAVHSSKDMPVVLPEGLTIAAVLPREDPRDAVVLPAMADGSGLMAEKAINHQPSAIVSLGQKASPMVTLEDLLLHLGQSPRIGTGSVRRVSQITRLMPGANFLPIRGNLDTRLRKLDGGEYDALVLAAAGLRRLGFTSRISLALPASACVPAPGQGIVAVEIRADDDEVRRAVAGIDDPAAAAALNAERALVVALGGGCQTPIGALASPVDDDLELVAVVVSLDGSRAVRGQARGPRHDAAALGARVGAQLLADGADQILLDARTQTVDSRQSSPATDRSS